MVFEHCVLVYEACRAGRWPLSACRSAPTREMRPYLAVGVGGGCSGYVPDSLLDTRMAEFQRFGICVPVRSVSRSAPTGRYARFLRVGVGRGYASLRPASSVRFRNGYFPTICDFKVRMACIQSSPNWEIDPFLAGCGRKGVYVISSRVSCVIEKRPFSNDLRLWSQSGPHSIRPQPERYARI
jgi:hypothetical protein